MQHPEHSKVVVRGALIVILSLLIVGVALWTLWTFEVHRVQTLAQQTATSSANLPIGGFLMSGDPAPDFTLVDQFGHAVSLSSLRGREVVLAFIDSRCKDVCPLTAQIMYDARARLEAASASQVQLVAVNANPTATSVADVRAWSTAHGMLYQWSFLTGSAQQLESVYQQYHVLVQVGANGQVVHDAATFIIDAQGRERLSYWTMSSNNQTDLGNEISGLQAGMQQWLP